MTAVLVWFYVFLNKCCSYITILMKLAVFPGRKRECPLTLLNDVRQQRPQVGLSSVDGPSVDSAQSAPRGTAAADGDGSRAFPGFILLFPP